MEDEIKPQYDGALAQVLAEDLSLLSEHELVERIALLEGEIGRVQAILQSKKSSRGEADALFKKS